MLILRRFVIFTSSSDSHSKMTNISQLIFFDKTINYKSLSLSKLARPWTHPLPLSKMTKNSQKLSRLGPTNLVVNLQLHIAWMGPCGLLLPDSLKAALQICAPARKLGVLFIRHLLAAQRLACLQPQPNTHYIQAQQWKVCMAWIPSSLCLIISCNCH